MMAKKIVGFILILFLVVGGIGGGYWWGKQGKVAGVKTEIVQPRDKYVAFLSEVFDTIQKNYWDKLSDEQLNNIFILGMEKLTGRAVGQKPVSKEKLMEILVETEADIATDKKKEFSSTLADMVLANLPPNGRSRLYSLKDETNLSNNVNNKEPSTNQYEVLGVDKNANKQEIDKKFNEESKILAKESSPAAKQKLVELEKAYKAVGDEGNRKVYDVSGVEPTMEYKLISPEVFYVHWTKFSPTTMDELVRVTAKVDAGNQLHSLILDMRDNVGGAIDGLPYFLGPFIGNDQYAYQFFHQGEKTDFKTRMGWLPSLVRYKKIVVLINKNSQSTAEAMAATLKKYNVGVLMGETSRGWGTVEKVYQLEHQIDDHEKYSVYLVNSLTIREDGQPIEGRGVEPVIKLADPSWKKQLMDYYNFEPLVKAVESIQTLP